MTEYLFRGPKYPIIVFADGSAFVARSLRGFHSLAKRERWEESDWELALVVDSSLEGFSYYPEIDTISPLCVEKRWTKKGLIHRVNARENKPDGSVDYPTTSLSSKNVAHVVGDLAALLGR